MGNLDDANVYGIGGDEGAPLPIHCPKCRILLTVVLLNERSTIDITVECARCGGKAVGTDLRAEVTAKMDVTKIRSDN